MNFAIPDIPKAPPPLVEEGLRRIFVIEDNEMHSMMVDYRLSQDNTFKIFKFKTGEECLQKMDLKPDLIILDYGLPGINGIETYSEIKKVEPDVPVVVISENSTDKVIKKFKEMGAYEFIVKGPESFHKLNSIVETIFMRLAEKREAANDHTRRTIIYRFILFILLAGILSYLLLKR